MNMQEFQQVVWDYYTTSGRSLPWREPEIDGSFDAYKILVSEVMLQQTQAARVIPKYLSFIEKFPDVQALAKAPLSAVLAAWNGLGYNRRAQYLHLAAQTLISRVAPWKQGDLVACKGIGPNTAAAVCVYAYNVPLVFIETNIRRVFIHHFFAIGSYPIADKELLPLVEAALDREHPREWYWALMDYGVHLKATVGNASRASKHYAKQSRFEGSKRQVRGQVLRLLGAKKRTFEELESLISDARLPVVLADLKDEGLISIKDELFMLG
jgi:A/G-specific adenine glycosylase